MAALDVHTAQLAAAIALGAVALHLSLTSSLRRDDRAGRVLATAFVTISGTAVLALTLPGDGTALPLVASAAAAGYALAFGLLRAGLRLLQSGGRPPLAAAFLAFGLTTASGLVDVSPQGLPLPLVCSIVFSTIFAAACVVESLLGSVSSRPSARSLQGVMGTVTVLMVVTSGLTLTRVVEWTAAIDLVVAIGSLVVFVLAALCVTSLKAEVAQPVWWSDDVDTLSVGFEIGGPETFRREALDRIDRCRTRGTPVGLVWVEVQQLDDIERAFGADARDRVVVHVGSVIRSKVPEFATVGHLGGGRFAVLSAARAARPIDRVANAIRHGLDLRAPDVPIGLGLRIGVSVATPPDVDLAQLITSARTSAAGIDVP